MPRYAHANKSPCPNKRIRGHNKTLLIYLTYLPAFAATVPACAHVYSPKKPNRSNVSIYPWENRVIGEGRICRPPPGPVDNLRVVTRHIDNLRIDRINFDRITFDNYLLFSATLEISLGECFQAESLNGCRYIGSLS